MFDLFDPKSYLELGAGYCHWAKTARDLKVDDIVAVDGPWTDIAKIQIDRDKFVVKELDVPLDLNRKFDMALSLEVGEHVKTSASKTLVRSLTRHSDLVVFGAATPHQGGFMHINEQWQSYWRDLFAEDGFQIFDIIRPQFWNDDDVIYYYKQNAFVYVRGTRDDLVAKCSNQTRQLAKNPIVDMIHPVKYAEMATYDVVLMKNLIKKLPGHLYQTALRKAGLAG